MQKALRDRGYLNWLKTQRCLLTGQPPAPDDPIDPAHIGTLGKGIKSADCHAIPLRHSFHLLCHTYGEISTIRKWIPDAVLREAMRCYAEYVLYREYLDEKADNNPT